MKSIVYFISAFLVLIYFIMMKFFNKSIPISEFKTVSRVHPQPKNKSSKSTPKMVGNNCLFDASIEAAKFSHNSQSLREACDRFLISEGLPTIASGEPAGEQYIQALSFILGKKINVHKNNSNFLVKHEKVPDSVPAISIRHLGNEMAGHWIAA